MSICLFIVLGLLGFESVHSESLQPAISFANGAGEMQVGIRAAAAEQEPMGPQALVSDDSGQLYLLDSLNRRVLVINPLQGSVVGTVSLPDSIMPVRLVVRNNLLYALDLQRNAVLVATRTGTLQQALPAAESPLASGLAVDHNGKVYLQLMGNRERLLSSSTVLQPEQPGLSQNTAYWGWVHSTFTRRDAHSGNLLIQDARGARLISLAVQVAHTIGAVRLQQVDRAGNIYLAVEELLEDVPVMVVAPKVLRYAPGGVVSAEASIPLEENRAIPLQPLAITPEGKIYYLKVLENTAQVVALNFGQPDTQRLAKLWAQQQKAQEALLTSRPAAAGNAVQCTKTRAQVIQDAQQYLQANWVLGVANYHTGPASDWTSSCGSAEHWRLPRYLANRLGETIPEVPYAWGGYQSIDEFRSRIARGDWAGDICSEAILGNVAGVDCSGYVCQLLGVGHTNVAGLINLTYGINWNDLLPGDLIIKSPNSHVLLFAGFANGSDISGGVRVYEANGTEFDRVVNSYWDNSIVDSYTPRRFGDLCPDEPVTCPAITDWRGQYWSNQNLSGDPVLCRNDTNVDFNWGYGSPDPRVPNDHFSARWTRNMGFSAGRYRFHLRGDDGVRLWVDGNLIIDQWFNHAVREYTAEIDLASGNHDLKVEFYDNEEDAIVAMWWEGPIDPATLAAQINAYLAGKASPMGDTGSSFDAWGQTFDVDPRLLVAIAGAESTFGKNGDCATQRHNAWGYGRGWPSCWNFSTWDDGIHQTTWQIQDYRTRLGLTNIHAIGQTWCGSGCTDWEPNVRAFYAELGGNPDTNDLTYPGASVPICPAPSDPSATAISEDSVRVSWTDTCANEQSFLVYRDGALVQTVGAGTTSWTDTSRTCGRSYAYYIVAHNTAGDSPASATVSVSLVCPCTGCELSSSAWPMVGYNLQHTSHSPHNGPSIPQTKWAFSKGNSWASPSIGPDGTLYIGGAVGTGPADGALYALNPDGTVKWRFSQADERVDSAPAIAANGTIYFGSNVGVMYALNADGTLKWRYAMDMGDGAWSTSPAIAPDGTVYVGSGAANRLYAFNPDGTVKWRFLARGRIGSSPAVGADGVVYIGSDDHNVYAINPDGSQRWAYQTEGIAGSPVIAADDTIYAGSSDKKMHAINPDGSRKWTLTAGDSVLEAAIGTDGTVYFGSLDYRIYAVRPDGTLRWNYLTGGTVSGHPAIAADGTIYAGSNDGYLYALGVDGGLLWRHAAGGWLSSPAIGASGMVYVSEWGQYITAIGQKAQDPRPSPTPPANWPPALRLPLVVR